MNREQLKRIQVAIIGAGTMARDMAQAFTDNSAFACRYVCDLDPEKAAALANSSGASATTSLTQALDDPATDLVYIAVPPRFHGQIFRAAVDRGKHVLCEKPLCMTLEEGQAMVESARVGASKGLITAINYPMAYLESTALLRRCMEEGYLGRLRRIDLKLHFPKWPRTCLSFSPDDWINHREEGGVMREISTHLFFLLTRIFEEPRVVARAMAKIVFPDGRRAGSGPSETAVCGILELRGGHTVQIDALTNFAGARETVQLTLWGSEGTLQMDNFQFLKGSRHGEPLTYLRKDSNIDENAFMDSAHVVNHFKRALRQQAHDLTSIAVGFEVQRVLSAILESNGAWIDL